MLATLLSLPDHLLQAILSKCVLQEHVSLLITHLPPALHPALIAAAASSGILEIPVEDLELVLLTLPATAFPAPGLLSVRTPDTDYPTATAALLARSLSAHPSLTSLDISSAIFKPASLHAFSACMATRPLPGLRHLELSVHPGGCAALANCLRRLPALTELNAHMLFNNDASTQQPGPNPYLQFVSSPARLHSVQRLTFDEDARESVTKYADREADDPSSLFLLLPLVKLPSLSYLSFESSGCDIPCGSLTSTLCNITALQEVHLHIQPGINDKPLVQPQFHGKLPHLQRLRALHSYPAEALRAASLIALLVIESLTSLSVAGIHPDTPEAGESRDHVRALARCTALQHLELETLGEEQEIDPPQVGPDGSTQHSMPERKCSAALSSALQQLTGLKTLRLQSMVRSQPRAAGCVLCAANVAAGLLALSGLEELHLGRVKWWSSRLSVTQPQVLLDACATLPRLRVLALGLEGMRWEGVVAELPRLSCLTVLRLPADMVDGGGAGVDRYSEIRVHLPHCNLERL
eukprot:jgi/Ulvmu1/3445/UM016_0064.1